MTGGVRRELADPGPAASAILPNLGRVTLSEAAISAVTDRTNVSNIAPPGDVQAVNAHKAIAELREAAGVEADEARSAAREAVAAVGGRIESMRYKGGLRAGQRRPRVSETWWVPRSAIKG